MIDGGKAAHRSAPLSDWEQDVISARESKEEHIPGSVDAVSVCELIPVVSEIGDIGVGADTSNVGSSTGWTDEKHMLYITSLEESFVNQLYSGNGEINSAYRTPGVWQNTSYGGNGRNSKYDQGQGYWGMVDVDEAESRLSEVGYIGSPSYSRGSPYYMDDASSNGPRQERTSCHARQRTSGRSTAFNLHQHGHSFSWRTESSDQNFFDGEAEGRREQGRGRVPSEDQQKHAGRTEGGPSGGIGLH